MADEVKVRQFSDLSDLRRYKEELKGKIQSDEDIIAGEWHKIFYPPVRRGQTSTQQRLSNMMNVGVAVFDGLMLTWKLYRKYRYGVSFLKRRRR